MSSVAPAVPVGLDVAPDDIIAEVDDLRTRLGPRAAVSEPAHRAGVAELIEQSAILGGTVNGQALALDLREFDTTSRLPRTKGLINAPGSTTIFSLFNASYFPSLSLEWLDFRELPTDEHLATRYASPTRPVAIRRASRGFAARAVVALFPENSIDGAQEPEDSVFYFIDKFVERHGRVTRPMIREVMAPNSFPLVQASSAAAVQTASTWWVHLHEFHHRTGYMPIPEYLPYKSLKPLAGLEELRTDLKSVLACCHDHELPEREARLTYEYVLCERLLRYAVEGIPRPNYDAVSSQLLFNFLRDVGAIAVRDERIHLAPDVPDALDQFVATVEAIEAHVEHEGPERVQERLLAFANRYTDFDEDSSDYRHIPFFAEVKARLGV